MSKRKRSQKVVHTQNVPVYLKILGTETGDSTPSVIVSFGDRKYLFDCGEGLQRFCIEHKIKIKKIGKIFLTSNNIEAFGGLPGMFLTMGGVHSEKLSSAKEAAQLDICGPIGTERLVYASRKFYHVNSQAVRIRVADVLPTSCGLDICRDDYLSVCAVRVLSLKSTKECISYICTTASSRGKFLPKRAIEMGVKPGHNFGKLTRGLEVILENGKVVKPSDVMEPSNPGTSFAVVRCPGLDWIKSVVSNENLSWRKYKDMSCIVHIVPTLVLRNETYSKWAASFGEKTQHIVINHEVCPQNFVHVSTANAVERKFHMIPDLFPYRLFERSDPIVRLPISEFPQRCVAARNLLKFVLHPRSRQGIQTDDVLSSISSRVLKNRKEDTSPLNSTQQTHLKNDVVEIIFLGTSSAIPQKYRNVSGILVRFKGTTQTRNMLLDAGEGTFGQMVRLCGGVAAAKRDIANLECIWISHLHADHHLGLTRLLNHFNGKDPILVIGPAALQNWLDVVTQIHPEIKDRFVFVNATSMRAKSFKCTDCKYSQYAKSRLREVLRLNLETVPVFHPSSSSGLVLKRVDRSLKLVYSGDTRPCEHLIAAGKDATVLIHEATFEDGMEKEAKKKRHSTVSQALEVGRKMNAHRVILTHFSARYSKSSPCSDKTEKIYCKASDFFCIRSDQLSRMDEYHNAIVRAEKCLAEEDKDEIDGDDFSAKRTKLMLNSSSCCSK